MLESFVIKINKVVVIVRVHKIAVFLGEYKAGAYMQLRQHGIVRVADVEHLFGRIIQITALLVAQVGIGVPVAYDLARLSYADSTVVGSDNNPRLFLCQEFKQVEHW